MSFRLNFVQKRPKLVTFAAVREHSSLQFYKRQDQNKLLLKEKRDREGKLCWYITPSSLKQVKYSTINTLVHILLNSCFQISQILSL